MTNTLVHAGADGAEGKYRILAELGEGGTAIVYLAVAHGPGGFNKLVVLKTLKRTLAEDIDLRKMFMQEARVAARLNHPCIVQTYEVFDNEELPVIVMEYLEGQPLSKILRRNNGAFTLPMHLRVIAEALHGLQHAHDLTDFDGTPLGLVHRDMTPHNVFVTFEGQTKLLDFGIAKLTTAHPETQTGVIKGKLRYMPPEQIAGDPLDRRADIYAMGVMLWEAAAGQEMWKGFTDVTIMNRVLNGEIPRLREVTPNISEELERICNKALAPDVNDRYATANDLEAELDALLQSFPESPNNRTIGKTVSKLFSDVRDQTKALIEARLSKVASLSWEEYAATEASAIGTLMTGSITGGTSPRQQRARGRSARMGLLALSGAGVVAAATWAAAQRHQATQHSGSAPSAAPAPTAKAPTPTRIRVQLSATPADARLFFDGEPLPSNPFEREMAGDGSLHIVRAEAAGYNADMKALEATHDGSVELKLVRLTPPPVESAAPPVAVTHPRLEKRPPKPAPPKNDCALPYYIDANGTKKFKLQCL